jgi:hypothetical protein
MSLPCAMLRRAFTISRIVAARMMAQTSGPPTKIETIETMVRTTVAITTIACHSAESWTASQIDDGFTA